MIEPKELVEKGVCVSFSEARRLAKKLVETHVEFACQTSNVDFSKALNVSKLDKEVTWGRKPRKTETVWPKESRVTEFASFV